jgi:hypothetical protein
LDARIDFAAERPEVDWLGQSASAPFRPGSCCIVRDKNGQALGYF